MAWEANAATDQLIRTGATSLMAGAWTISCWFWTNGVGAGTGNIVTLCNDAQSVDYCTVIRRTNVIGSDYDDGGGFSNVDGTTVLSTNTWYHIYARYDGSVVRAYLNGTLEFTSAALAFTGGTEVLFFDNGGLGDPSLLGRIAGAKIWTSDLGESAGVITAESEYRNPQNSPGTCFEAWHAKTGDLNNGDLNGNDLTNTSITFVADPPNILGDDPGGGGGAVISPFYFKRRRAA